MRTILLICLIFITSLFVNAQNILYVSGYVFDIETNEPIVDQTVFVEAFADSTIGFYYSNMMITNSDGYYNDEINIGDIIEGEVKLSTYDCNNSLQLYETTFSLNNLNITYDFYICYNQNNPDCEAFYIYIQAPGMNGIQFLDQSWGGPTSWTWDFGDGTTSSEQNPIHEFEEAGEYEVCLSIFCEETGCEDTYCEIVIVEGGTPGDCDSFFEAMNNNNLTVNFEAYTMSIFPTEFDWNFGDGTVGTGQSISHTYDEEGLYLVTLHSIDSTGCEFVYEEEVRVFGPGGDCEAFYIYIQVPGMNGIQFLDQSFGGPTSWTWDFGDGTTSGEQNPIHEFEEAGEYEVCLSIFCEETGCEDTYCEIVIVEGGTPGDCDSFFEAMNNNGLTVDFEAYTVSIFPTEFDWNFGDGTVGTGQSISHTYDEEGLYLVTLHSIDTTGCEFVYEEEVRVFGPGGDCEAFYIYIQAPGMNGIQFLDQSFGGPTSWTWDFGDGTTSGEQNPIHEFEEAGEYEVCLSIFCEETGCEDTYCEIVIVEGGTPGDCDSFFEAMNNNNLTVNFEAYTVSIFPTEFDWNFGDGTVGTGQSISHIYPEEGLYLVTLHSIDSTGCEFVYEEEVRVLGQGGDCQALYIYFQDSLMNGIQFFDQSWGGPTTWAWDFGDGTTSGEQNPIHEFEEAGEYEVCLSIFCEETGCEDTYCEIVIVEGGTPGDCDSFFEAMNNNLTVNFEAYTVSIFPTEFDWNFGDGTVGTGQSISHTYDEEGLYLVTLHSIDSTGCEFTYNEEIRVFGPGGDCEAYYYYIQNPNSNGIQFFDASIGNPTSWFWVFSDSTTSTEQNPFHEFAEPGEYEVCLSIFCEETGCEDTYCEIVIVEGGIPGDCESFFYAMNNNSLTVDFEAYTMSIFPTEFDWNFGDGTSGTGQSISHTYTEEGLYLVTLHSIDSTGCEFIYEEEIYVGDMLFDIGGAVFLNQNIPADYADVQLMELDSITGNVVTIGTTTINDIGEYVFENFAINNFRMYFVQAELTEQSAYFGEYLPTYHISALYWEDANPIFPNPSGDSYDIYMLPVITFNPGIGDISGIVNSGITKGILSNVEMLLLDQNNDPLTYVRTNEEGVFDFGELSWGTYNVYTELVGVTTEPITITISENTPTANITIYVSNGSTYQSIDEPSGYITNVSEVYPNPVHSGSKINVSLQTASDLKLMIYNQVGQIVCTSIEALSQGSHRIAIETGNLNEGFYTLHIISDKGEVIVRKFIKVQ